MRTTPVPVILSLNHGAMVGLRDSHPGSDDIYPMHVMFGFDALSGETHAMLSITSDLDRGVVGFSPVELHFSRESWRALQTAVAAFDPFA